MTIRDHIGLNAIPKDRRLSADSKVHCEWLILTVMP